MNLSSGFLCFGNSAVAINTPFDSSSGFISSAQKLPAEVKVYSFWPTFAIPIVDSSSASGKIFETSAFWLIKSNDLTSPISYVRVAN